MIVSPDIWGKPKVSGSGTDSRLSVLVVDPGGTTGFVWLDVAHSELLSAGVDLDALARLFAMAAVDGRLKRGQLHSAPIPPNTMDSMFGLEAQVVSRLHTGALQLHAQARHGLSHVVIEDFIVRVGTQSRDLLSPVRLTSMLYDRLQHCAQLNVYVNMQSPSDAMSSVSDDQLRAAGVYWRGREHERAATKHLIVFLRRYMEELR